MNENELFSGIPALGDDAGLEAYLNNTALEGMGIGTQDPTPAALQQQQPITEPAPATPATPAAPAQPANVPQFTAEQVAEIVARSRATQQPTAQPQAPAQPQATGAYSPQQATIIKQLIDRGVPLERIMAAMNGNRQQVAQQSAQQSAMAQRLAQIEQHLQQQQYIASQNAFIDKMTTFGNKFGLSEDELVVFGNKAQSMGINLVDVSDVEAVFRAVYPEQYAIRSQRLAGASNSQLFGGASAQEPARAAVSKLEDAYVDQFLKRSMPNQYGMNSR